MAITFRQITEVSVSSGAATSSVTLNFSSTVAAGSAVAVACCCDSACTGITFSNSASDTYTDSGQGYLSNFGTTGLSIKFGVFLTPTAASNAFKATFVGSTTANYTFYAWEIAGLTSPQIDKVTTGTGTATAVSATSTGTLSSATEAAIVFGTSDNFYTAIGGGSWTSGQGSVVGTNTGDGANIDALGNLGEHQVTASNAALGASLGTINAIGHWGVVLMTLMSGGGSFTPTGQFIHPTEEKAFYAKGLDQSAPALFWKTPTVTPPIISGLAWTNAAYYSKR